MTDLPAKDTASSINIVEEMQGSYIDYSMSVIIGRALPDVRDGLKPVHRRALFAMRELGNTHNRPYKKSARVVGDVIGKYHPHGDTAVYDTVVRMAQDFSMRYPLVDGQGNFGSIDGDPPAAMRYTEVRMHRLAEEMLEDIDKDTVPFGPNYDESLEQPLVLPSKIPNLLLNGSTGIAVGMATNIPPHNMREIVDAIVMCIDRPELTAADLLSVVSGPDFPTGGIICGTRGIQNMYITGRGLICVRGRVEIEEDEAKGKSRLLITEIPYAVNKSAMIEAMAALVQSREIDGISDLRDESNSEGIRVVVELKRGVIPAVVLNQLYKHTQLQTTFGAILLSISEGRPKVMTLREMIAAFIEHRFEVVTRRTAFELRKAEARAHILEGLLIALSQLDDVVAVIRASVNRDEARPRLMERFRLSELQANAILDMRLYQLTGLEREKVESEHEQVRQRIAYLKDLLEHSTKIYDLIKDELTELKSKYGDARRTEIVPAEDEIAIEDLIEDKPCVISVTRGGYIKRCPLDTYQAQNRGGRGVSGMAVKDEDFVEHLFSARAHDTILFFTTAGQVYARKAYTIPEAGRLSRGKAIVNLIDVKPDEQIASLLCVRDFPPDVFLVMATARGQIKKTSLAAYRNIRRDSIIAILVDDGDRVISVKLTSGSHDLILATANGMSIRFPERQIRSMGRGARGVRGIRLDEGDIVCSLDRIDPDTTYFVATENGYGKRTPFDEYRRQQRGGRGTIAVRTSERNGRLVAACAVHDPQHLMLMTANGMVICVRVADIGCIGRNTQGVRLINLQENDTLVSAATVTLEEDFVFEDNDGVAAPDSDSADRDFDDDENGEEPETDDDQLAADDELLHGEQQDEVKDNSTEPNAPAHDD